MTYEYDQKALRTKDGVLPQEWYLPDGMGGYAAGSVTNRRFRKHQGYLVVSLNPPTDRTLLLAKVDETMVVGGRTYDLIASTFSLDEVATYGSRVGGVTLEKTVAPRYGGNAVAIRYRIATGKRAAHLCLVPQFTWRNHGDVRTPDRLTFLATAEGARLVLIPDKAPSRKIVAQASLGTFVRHDPAIASDVTYAFDAATGDDRVDAFFQAYALVFDVPAETTLTASLVVALDELPAESAEAIVEASRTRVRDVVLHAGMVDDFAARLVRAGDLFLAHRRSTGLATVLAGLPWFADWGRDTMIAFEGLCLVTKRFPEAREILASFARYEKDGLIPNMFPDAGQDPYYNTADASLWYVHAVDRYLSHTDDEALVRTLFPTLVRIVDRYRHGTGFSIRMDSDGLMRAGSGLDQVTWMDVRIDGVVVTPRHGKPVEINALWHNALCVMDGLARRLGSDPKDYGALTERVRKSFNRRFWNPAKGCLHDVVDPEDPSVRPNMLFACSLPHPLLSQARIRSVVAVATRELLDVYGLRSLSKCDPRFVPEYSGPLRKRDFSYHMGTTWGFLIGTYVDAYLKAHPTDGAKRRMKRLCRSFEDHLREGCVGGVAEIFDGLHGRVSRGCSSQAWSVGELLRTYVQNGLDRI
ncbi:MAG: amylo-alpha-1,6-glucosidase [Candidatus Izemoplasmatales bacterium]